jgi:hypothetical protein
MWTDLGIHDERPATNCLSHGLASLLLYKVSSMLTSNFDVISIMELYETINYHTYVICKDEFFN